MYNKNSGGSDSTSLKVWGTKTGEIRRAQTC